MKILLAGPSLHGVDLTFATKGPRPLTCRGPAAQGDIARAVIEGAKAIGLVDGRYEDVAAVWHKEILYALERGVLVFGAASMGALRAAECAPFGMIGVGAVFERYRSGILVADAAVAQLHAPGEMNYAPLTEALVNVEASIDRFVQLRAISGTEAERLLASARGLFFKDRTYRRILDASGFAGSERGRQLGELFRRCKADVKKDDALVLLNYMTTLDPTPQTAPAWSLNATHTFELTLERARRAAAAEARPAE